MLWHFTTQLLAGVAIKSIRKCTSQQIKIDNWKGRAVGTFQIEFANFSIKKVVFMKNRFTCAISRSFCFNTEITDDDVRANVMGGLLQVIASENLLEEGTLVEALL